MGFLRKIFDSEYKELSRFEKLAQEIEALEPEMQALSDEELKNKTGEFRAKLDQGATIECVPVSLKAVSWSQLL